MFAKNVKARYYISEQRFWQKRQGCQDCKKHFGELLLFDLRLQAACSRKYVLQMIMDA